MIYYGVFLLQENKIKLTVILMICIAVTSACGWEKTSSKKLNDVDYTIVSSQETPKEVIKIIEERKEKEFKVTYSDEQYTYIVIGYGKQKYSGYSITVTNLYETANAVFVKLNLRGRKNIRKRRKIHTRIL